MAGSMFDPSVFAALQAKIDEEAAIRESLRELVQTIEKQDRATQTILSRAHSTPRASLLPVLEAASAALTLQTTSLAALAQTANQHPYYKYSHIWTRSVQDTVSTTLLHHWLSAYASTGTGTLLSLTALGAALGLPVEPLEQGFRITIEEYLHGIIGVVDETARLSRNAVTMGDYGGAGAVAVFVKDVHAGFQVLNLKNDALRKRGDGVKYRVKEVEDVVYDLSLRGLGRKE